MSDHWVIQPRAWKPLAEAQAMECLLLSAQRWDGLTTTAGLSALGANAATGITSTCSHTTKARRAITRAGPFAIPIATTTTRQ